MIWNMEKENREEKKTRNQKVVSVPRLFNTKEMGQSVQTLDSRLWTVGEKRKGQIQRLETGDSS